MYSFSLSLSPLSPPSHALSVQMEKGSGVDDDDEGGGGKRKDIIAAEAEDDDRSGSSSSASEGAGGASRRGCRRQQRSPLALFEDLTQFMQPEPPHLARGRLPREKEGGEGRRAFRSEGGEGGGGGGTHLSNDLPERGKEKRIRSLQQGRWRVGRFLCKRSRWILRLACMLCNKEREGESQGTFA